MTTPTGSSCRFSLSRLLAQLANVVAFDGSLSPLLVPRVRSRIHFVKRGQACEPHALMETSDESERLNSCGSDRTA